MRGRLLIGALLVMAVLIAAAGASAGPVSQQEAISPGRPHVPRSIAHWRPHVAIARRYARRRAGLVAFAVMGPRRGLRGYRIASTAPSASVFKVMLLASYLRMRSVRRRPLRRSDRRLLRPMIRHSDNFAASLVRNIVGRRRVVRLARRAGMRDFGWDPVWGLCRTSPRDQARFMYRLRRYIPRIHRRFALRQLARIVPRQRWGIGRVAATAGWHLFFKGGWGSGSGLVDHQVALLLHGRARISLAIFTQYDPGHAYGKRTLRGVAARLLRGLPD